MKEWMKKNKRLTGLLGVLVVVLIVGLALPEPKSNQFHLQLKEFEYNPFIKESMVTKEEILKKKYVLIEFFTHRCPHCVASVPALNELNEHKDISVVAYNMSTKSKVKKYIETHNVEYPIARASKNYLDVFEPVAVPMSFLMESETLEVKAKFIGKVTKEKVLEHL